MRPKAIGSAMVVAVLGGLPTTSPAAGQGTDVPGLWPTFSASAGALLASHDSSLRLDAGAVVAGTEVDLERDLGLEEDETLLAARLAWRFADRHQLALAYFASDRSGGRRLERTIVVDDTVFPVGIDVDAALDRRQLELAYTGWLVKRERFGAGLALGAVLYDLDAEVSAATAIGPIPIARTERWSESAPAPAIGVELRGAPLDRLVLHGRIRHLPRVRIDDVEGEATGFSVGAEYRIAGPFALGVGYERDALELEAESDDWRGSADLDLSGFRLSLLALF
jgi:hypothetical protein